MKMASTVTQEQCGIAKEISVVGNQEPCSTAKEAGVGNQEQRGIAKEAGVGNQGY